MSKKSYHQIYFTPILKHIKSLEQTQKTIESQLERTEATQNELQNAMVQNLQVATENAKKLTERVEKLQ